MRESIIERKTFETDIYIKLNVEGKGRSSISTGCGFLNHMLTLFAKHGRFDIDLTCKGDIDVDFHHTTEDIGIALGQAFKKAIGDGKGIVRYGSFLLPMDESLILSAVDICGRSYLSYSLQIPSFRVGDFDTELVNEFFTAFVGNFPISLHIKQLDGKNTHHIIEATFKSVSRAIAIAIALDNKYNDEIPSTKGKLF